MRIKPICYNKKEDGIFIFIKLENGKGLKCLCYFDSEKAVIAEYHNNFNQKELYDTKIEISNFGFNLKI